MCVRKRHEKVAFSTSLSYTSTDSSLSSQFLSSSLSSTMKASPQLLRSETISTPKFNRQITEDDMNPRYSWPLMKHDFRRPMKLLIEGEYNGIEYLRVIIDMYLPEYRRADKSNALPPMLKGKEKEIFGNIEDIYEFHQHFVKELELYENNPMDVASAFMKNFYQMKDIYSKYLINKERNGAIHHKPETITFFAQILDSYSGVNNDLGKEQLNLDFDSYAKRGFFVNLDSVLLWPVQRLFKYSLILKDFAPYEISEIVKVKEAIDGIIAYANGFVKIADIAGFKVEPSEVFCMADTFVVTDQRRIFKKEKEYLVFLFETFILLTRERSEKNGLRYVFKEQIMLSDIHIVEHPDAINTKFGLRNQASGDNNALIFKADSEKVKQLWVKKLRELTNTKVESRTHSRCSSSSSLPAVRVPKKLDTNLLTGLFNPPSFSSRIVLAVPHGDKPN